MQKCLFFKSSSRKKVLEPVSVPTESRDSVAAPRGQQEPDPGAGADTDGWRRAGRTDPTKARRFQHTMGRPDGKGETLCEGYK